MQEASPRTKQLAASVLATKLDRLYNRIDRIYHRMAQPSGVSDCAYWLMYALAESGRPLAQRALIEKWSYSKQTVNSALGALEAKGLVRMEFEEGSRRNKVAALTQAGAEFAARHVEPMMAIEEKAFDALDERERSQLVDLLSRYADALEGEAERLLAARGKEVGA